jgi:16S rRNA (guanine966-N2)-methyltransferase
VRVTGGALAGRRFAAPRSGAVRPTADRVRESLFAALGDLAGTRVLDLFAGSGGLAIEALSRGAESACLVERGAVSLRTLRSNLGALGLERRSRVLAEDALRAIRRLAGAGEQFELILADPPYASGMAPAVLEAVAGSGLLAAGGVLVVETDRRHPPGAVTGLRVLDLRRYGDTLVSLFTPAEVPAAPPEAGTKGTIP